MRLPDFAIIGAMKCMTSTLHNQLASQPGIFMSTPKEPCYFSDDAVYRQGIAWYQSLFAGADSRALCGESSTHYTKLPTHPHTRSRMRATCPSMKLIYIMRHPIDRLVSHYIHEWTQRTISVSLDRALDEHPELIDYSRYAYQLRGYLRDFGPQLILPVFFDRLRYEPQRELERICDFLGYSGSPKWQADCDADNVSAERLRVSRLRDAVVNAPGLSWIRTHLIPQNVRNWFKRFWQLRTRPTISPARTEQLIQIFDLDLRELGAWIDVKLNCDNFRQATSGVALDWSSRILDRLQDSPQVQEAGP